MGGGGGGAGVGPSGPSPDSSFSGPPVLSEEQLSRLPKEELVARLKSREGECVRLMKDRAQLMKDVNRTLQVGFFLSFFVLKNFYFSKY